MILYKHVDVCMDLHKFVFSSGKQVPTFVQDDILKGILKPYRLMMYLMSFCDEVVDLLRLVVQGDLECQDTEHREADDNEPHNKSAYYTPFVFNNAFSLLFSNIIPFCPIDNKSRASF